MKTREAVVIMKDQLSREGVKLNVKSGRTTTKRIEPGMAKAHRAQMEQNRSGQVPPFESIKFPSRPEARSRSPPPLLKPEKGRRTPREDSTVPAAVRSATATSTRRMSTPAAGPPPSKNELPRELDARRNQAKAEGKKVSNPPFNALHVCSLD